MHSNKNSSINYDFVEIGTSDFATLIGRATDLTVGISIEPLEFYLNKLPNKLNVKKLAVAVVTEARYKISHNCNIFYIKDSIISSRGLGHWLKGCNSIDKPHPAHSEYLDIVSIATVPCITFSMLVKEYSIERIQCLKIDIEGGDCALVVDIISYYSNNLELLPKKIYFEINHALPQEVEYVKELLVSLGYRIGKDGINLLATLL